jgi:hypothetical protein
MAVPALRMATMRAASFGQIDAEVSVAEVERQLAPNCVLNSGMARIPFMALHTGNRLATVVSF